MFRLGFQYEFVYSEVNNGYDQQPNDREVELSACLPRCRLGRFDVLIPFDPFRRQLERPGQDQRQRKAHNHEEYQ